MSLVEFSALRYRFPGSPRDVLDGVDWKTLEGSFTLVVGPSGSGKTTFLRCMNGLVPHFHGGHFGGSVRVAGLDTREAAPRDLAHTVGTVFQDPEAQSVTEIVEDEIVFTMENLGFDRQTMRVRLDETLDLLRIPHLRHREVSSLSGGERQRVAIAAAIATRPRLLVLDEPTSQLDPLSARDVLTAVEQLNADLGMTVVLAEHRLDRTLPFVEHVIAMDESGFRSGSRDAMLETLEDVPPLVAYARHVGWQPPPLTIRDARRWLNGMPAPAPSVRRSPSTGQRLIEVRDVDFSYGGEPALRRVSFDGSAGEVIVLTGRNGSGKTTLLKQLNGLLRPERGRVTIGGEDVAGQPVHRIARTVGYVPQHPTAILHQETLGEELAFTARARSSPLDPLPILEQLGISQHIDRNPLDLSGGERQRAALAAVAAGEPPVLLLDEPTRGLPGLEKQRLARFVREYADRGRLVIVATHDVEFAAQCADRVLLLSEGELIADGEPADVLAGSPVYATQMNRLFGGRVLTLEDAGVEIEALIEERH